MANELTVHQGGVIEAQRAPITFDRDQVELLKQTICKGATDNELQLFLQVCKLKRLDPFSKQIYAIKRWDPEAQNGNGGYSMTFQVGIDGFRSKAEETGLYDGQDPPQWCGPDGIWKDIWLADYPPSAAKVTLYRKGWARPVIATAMYREYVQTKRDGKPNSMWSKMAANQLAKVAEALAFRKGFPEQLGGLNTEDEMPAIEVEPEHVRQAREAEAQRNAEQAVLRGRMDAATSQTQPQTPTQSPQGAAVQNPVTQPAGEQVDPDVQNLWAGMTNKESTLKTFAQLKAQAVEILGEAAGLKGYYGFLAQFGVQHANEFKSTKPARQAAAAIFVRLREVFDDMQREKAEAEAAAKNVAEDAPFGDDPQ